jgi:3-hydroxyisobutyrate dehydrogenase-like beta-hydroxyacid dehydrogenase
MGGAFAENLLADGHTMAVFDKKPDLVRALTAKGAIAVDGWASIGACAFVLTSLPDDTAVSAVADELVPTLGRHAIHVSTSTISASLSRRLAERHTEHGQGYVALPVLGNPDLAHRRSIYLLASGTSSDIDRIRPIFGRLGQRLFVIGSDPALANIMKLACNVLTAATLQSMGEVLALLRKSGIDPQTGYEVLTGSLFDGKVHKAYGGEGLAIGAHRGRTNARAHAGDCDRARPVGRNDGTRLG